MIVWDINAFYFVYESRNVKLECVVEAPESRDPSQWDELFAAALGDDKERHDFRDNEPGKWYKIICRNQTVRDIKTVVTSVEFPGEELRPPDSTDVSVGNNLVEVGLLLELGGGFIPAFVAFNCYGFHNWPKQSFYTNQEIEGFLGKLANSYVFRG